MQDIEIEKLSGITQPHEKMIQYKQFWADKCGIMLLSGKNGRGKSYVARAFYHAFLFPLKPPARDWDQAFFMNQSDLNMLWLSETSKYNDSLALMVRIKNAKYLCIDDLGTRKPSDAFQDFLYALIDYRYENRKTLATIYTTNLDSAGMASMFGDAILSRVSSGIVQRFLEGEDRRLHKN